MLSPLPRHSDRDHSCSLTQSYQPSPKWLSGRPVQRPFRGLLSVHSRYGLHTRAATIFCGTLHRRLQPLRYLHSCSGCFRLERIAGWDLHPLGKRRLTTAHARSGTFLRSKFGGEYESDGLSKDARLLRSFRSRIRDLSGKQIGFPVLGPAWRLAFQQGHERFQR